MRSTSLALAVVTVLVLSGAVPARAAPLGALPPSVRINIGLEGTSYAVVSASGPFVVTTPEGQEIYRNSGRVAVRTNVLRLADDQTPIPRGPVDTDERPTRMALQREARLAARVSPGSILRIPFELEALAAVDTGFGPSIFRAQAVAGLRIAPADKGVLLLDGKGFRGTFEIAPADLGFTIINTVATDQYLVSVVGSEIPTEWAREALAAQAVAARTYLLNHLGKHGSYDLDGDERDQAYKGLYGETEGTKKAVEKTKGLVLTYRGAVIDAFYSANAGGVTEDSENVWTTPLPYLRSVPSPADTVALKSSWGATSYEWNKEYTEPLFRTQLLKRGINVGRVLAVDILQKSASGGVLLARVRGTLGSRDVVKDDTRWRFGLKSQLFRVEFRPATDVELVKVDDAVRILDMTVLGADRTAIALASSATAADGSVVVSGFKSTGYVYKLPPRIVFYGKGYGHRVGMSQWGMLGMAQQGSSFEEILKHYYQGVALTKVDGP
jgi:stage II sporulation protein D